MKKQLRVLVATADNLAGIGVCTALADDSTLDLVHLSLHSMDTLFQEYVVYSPCVLVLVVTSECLEIVKSIQSLSNQAEPVAMVVVAAVYDETCVRALLPFAASGFLLITDPPDLLRYTVHAVGLGSSLFATAILNRFYSDQQLHQAQSPQEQRLTQLTQREHEVFLLLKQGYNNEQIAQRLHVTARTIRFHIRNIYDKLSFSSRGEAIAWAFQTSVAA